MLSTGGPGQGASGQDASGHGGGGHGSGLAAVFEPRRVALVGASDRPGSVGRLLWDNLAGFPGEVLPVCPAATVAGRPAYADLRDVPGEVDLAVIATPAATVPGIIGARPPTRGSGRRSCSARDSRRPVRKGRGCRRTRWPRPGRAGCAWSGPTASAFRTRTFH
jgi:hypothetical protein